MAVLRAMLASTVLAACYSPQLRDCAVACESAGDCAPSQVCGADRWCAAPSVAGSCNSADAAAGTDASPTVIEDAAIDALPPVILVVQIAGHGVVSIPGVGSCADTAPGDQCTFALLGGTQLTLTAMGSADDKFEKWTSVACTGQTATCTLTPVASSTTVAVKFSH